MWHITLQLLKGCHDTDDVFKRPLLFSKAFVALVAHINHTLYYKSKLIMILVGNH